MNISQKIQLWEKEINDITKICDGEFGNLSPELLNKKTTDKSWSIAQCIEHLIITNESYYPIIKNIRADNYSLPFISRFDFITEFFGNLVMGSVLPDRKRKVSTFPIWQPSQSQISGDIIERFSNHQKELIRLIKDSRDLLENGQVICSPANRIIVYKLEKAFEILVSHEKRHLNQALEVKKLSLKD